MINKTLINWTSFVIALLFMGAVFSFNALAQTDSVEPMKAKSLAALIKELKEVVSKNTPDQKDALLVGKKWDQRKDLAGKSKKDVIELLYKDVKSVIKDSGVLYQIYSIFSFYKQIPDEFLTTPTKADSVKNLIAQTLSSHPSVMSREEGEALLPKDKESQESDAMVKQNTIKIFEEALKKNKVLNIRQKTFVRGNYDKLLIILNKQTADGIKADFPVGQWISESLEQGYNSNFTDQELTGLLTFFQSPAGQQVLKSYKYLMISEVIVQKGGAPLYTKEDKAEADKFAATPVGTTFKKVFFDDAGKYAGDKMEAVYKGGGKPKNNIFTIMGLPNINKVINQFVKDNYKK